MTGRAAMVRFALVLAIGASLVGCAVMRIDVDVYKGPLANHEEVQTEQFAAMAIGAKPLLIQLRDFIEWEDKKTREGMREKPWYLAGYIPPSDEIPKPYFNDDQAKRVNSVLYLYEDANLSGLGWFIERAGAILTAVRKAQKSYSPNREEDRRRWKRFAKKFVNPDEFKGNEAKILSELIDEYKQYLYPGSITDPKDPRKYYRDVQCIEKTFGRLDSNEARCNSKEDDDWYSRLKELRDASFVRRHAIKLFKDANDPAVDEFVESVVAIPNAYIGALNAFRDLWEMAIEVLQFVDSPAYRGPSKDLLRVELARLISRTTQQQHLAGAILLDMEGDLAELKMSLRGNTIKVLGASTNWFEKTDFCETRKYDSREVRLEFELANKTLQEALFNDPTRILSSFCKEI